MKENYSEEEQYEKEQFEDDREVDNKEDYVEENYEEPNLLNALLAGLFGACVGAGLWAIVGAVFHIQIGLVAIVIGLIVGHMVNRFGHGDTDVYRIIGVVFSLVGCVLGKYSVIFFAISKQYDLPVIEVLNLLNGEIFMEITTTQFSITDLGFFAFAAFQGYKLSVQRKVDPSSNIV